MGRPRNEKEHLSSDGTPYETIGIHGIEAIMDPQLQGEPGSVFQRVSSQGYTIPDPDAGGAMNTPPTIGQLRFT